MLTISMRKVVYGSVAMIGLLALAFGGLGLVRAAGNSQATDARAICASYDEVLRAVNAAATAPDVDEAVRSELESIADQIRQAIRLQNAGEFERAAEITKEIIARLEAVAERVGSNELSGRLLRAAAALEPCLLPSPVPQPASHLVYSAKFVCGRTVHREAGVNPTFGRQSSLYTEQIYQTEINVHNYHLNRVSAWGQVMVANSHDEPRGPVSVLTNRVIRPNEAFKVNCQDIREALGGVDPGVCPGARVALNILVNILEAQPSDVVSADLLAEIREVAAMIEKSIALEEQGAFDEAHELQRQAVQTLTQLAEKARAAGNERLARALVEARDILRRCLLSASGETDALSSTDAAAPQLANTRGVVEGFVVIRTPEQLEVTGVYRANSHNETISGGIGSGTSIDVEQISPHRVGGPVPLPADTAQ